MGKDSGVRRARASEHTTLNTANIIVFDKLSSVQDSLKILLIVLGDKVLLGRPDAQSKVAFTIPTDFTYFFGVSALYN